MSGNVLDALAQHDEAHIETAADDRVAPGNSLKIATSRLANAALVALALCLGFGDIAQVSPFTAALLNSVHALLPLALGLAALAILTSRQWHTPSLTIALPLAAWLAVQLGSALTAPSHRDDALATLGRTISGVLLAATVATVCQRRKDWRKLQKALALGGLAVASVALAEATDNAAVQGALAQLHDAAIPIGDVPRVAATLSHPNATAMLLELCLPLLVAWMWSAHRHWRIVLTLAAMATLTAIVLTFSRAGIATALLSLAILASLAVRRHQRRYALAIPLIAVVVPLTLGWSALADPGLDRRLLAGLDESSSIQPPRTEFWRVATQMARDHPLLGVGPDNFRWLFDSYSGGGADNLGIHAHDQYLEAVADTGVLGLVSLLAVFATLVLRAGRALRHASMDWPWRAALLASLSAWLVHALVDDFERFWPTSVAFWLIAGLAIDEPVDAADDGDHHEQHENARRAAERRAAATTPTETDHDGRSVPPLN